MKIAKILAAGGKPPARQQLNNFICPGIQNEFLQGGRNEQNPTESRSWLRREGNGASPRLTQTN